MVAMLLTRAADYAVRVMIHLAAAPPEERRSLPGLAEATGAPASFLSKVMQTLARAGMVISRRGSEGGFEISALGRKANLREVIEAVDGPLFLNVCVGPGKACSREDACPAHPVWVKAQEGIVAVLEAANIADLSGQAASQPNPTKDSTPVN
jgi:Rrf2 family protein